MLLVFQWQFGFRKILWSHPVISSSYFLQLLWLLRIVVIWSFVARTLAILHQLKVMHVLLGMHTDSLVRRFRWWTCVWFACAAGSEVGLRLARSQVQDFNWICRCPVRVSGRLLQRHLIAASRFEEERRTLLQDNASRRIVGSILSLNGLGNFCSIERAHRFLECDVSLLYHVKRVDFTLICRLESHVSILIRWWVDHCRGTRLRKLACILWHW